MDPSQMKHRLSRFRENMKSGGVLILNPVNTFYFTGSSLECLILVTPKKAFIIADSRSVGGFAKLTGKEFDLFEIVGDYYQALGEFFRKVGVRKIAFETKGVDYSQIATLKDRIRSAQFKPIDVNLEKIRSIKDPQEIHNIQKAVEKTVDIFLYIKCTLKKWQKRQMNCTLKKQGYRYIKRTLKKFPCEPHQVSELDIAHQIYRKALEFGCTEMAFKPIVAFGKNSAIPHHQPGNTKLKQKDTILLDLGVKYNNYCADLTRVLFYGSPNTFQAKTYILVLNAQLAAERKIQANVPVDKICAEASQIFDNANVSPHFLHSLGHGVGIEIHENPRLIHSSKEKLQENQIITIEPGLYYPQWGGIRLEDMLWIRKNQVEVLTKIPKDLESAIL